MSDAKKAEAKTAPPDRAVPPGAPRQPRVTLYQWFTPAGTVGGQVAGLTLDATRSGKVLVAAADLAGHAPQKGDRLTTAAGDRLRVKAAGELGDDGRYPLTCEPEGV